MSLSDHKTGIRFISLQTHYKLKSNEIRGELFYPSLFCPAEGQATIVPVLPLKNSNSSSPANNSQTFHMREEADSSPLSPSSKSGPVK